MTRFNVYQNGKVIDVVSYQDHFTAADVTRELNRRGDYNGVVSAFRQVLKKRGTDIRTVLKNAKTVLFNDDEYFNKDITGVKNLVDIKDQFSIRGNLKLVSVVGTRYEYKLVNSSYSFSIICM